MCIAVAARNHDVLENLAFNITTPGHSMHRRYLSYDGVHGLLANPAATARVLAWVASEPGLKSSGHPPPRSYDPLDIKCLHLVARVGTTFGVYTPETASVPAALLCSAGYCKGRRADCSARQPMWACNR